MPTFDDPLADAAEASAALRGLAHATRTFSDPTNTYQVIGDLLAGVRSLRQVLDQLANAHVVHRAPAHHDAGNQLAGAHAALAAADELHQAGTVLDAAHDRLDADTRPCPTPAASPGTRRSGRRRPRWPGLPHGAPPDPFRANPFSRDSRPPQSTRGPSL